MAMTYPGHGKHSGDRLLDKLRQTQETKMARHELSWTNITRDGMSSEAQSAFDMVLESIAALEVQLASDAVAAGAASESDAFKFAYRSIKQGSIGMAIDVQSKGQASGFAGLKRPVDKSEVETAKLADYLDRQKALGRRF